ncbi:haloacid dehalogenase [Oceaniferula spumae]|uniref:Haloacid dehalogenase n=1 Tax=Oceaniferula spumae TaxID=2979115 RepID=A0AAT9FL10_9BACT
MNAQESQRGYALFDLDQTLIPWDTQLLFCNFVLKRMPWRRFYLLILVPFLPLTKILGSEGMKRVFLNYLWGLDQEKIEKLGAEFVSEIMPDGFYPEMLEVVREQKESGRLMVLSSASPEIWVKPIAQRLGFDHCFGTEVDMTGGVKLFPDILGGNNKGANKLEKMRAVLPEGFDPESGDTLPNSHGFSDSHADLPMLRICENASMVNPTEKLSKEGSMREWSLYSPNRPTQGKRQFAIACLKQALGIY